MPGYVKIILLAQAVTILSLTLSMYQVYVNDIYFQEYIIGLFRSNIIANALLSTVTASLFALGTFLLLGSMGPSRRVNKEWRLMSETEAASHLPSPPVLETVEPLPKPRSTARRPRRRRTTADTDKLFDSMRYFADDQRQN
jgi:hypothetical protein